MYFDDEDMDQLFNYDLYHGFSRELNGVGTNEAMNLFDLNSHILTNVPTHTEDGIPIRKLYVSNLPQKTSRAELFGVFAQYGFIKSCWLRMGDRGPNKSPVPTYAFVTFSNPADAHKALLAPLHEKILRGRHLKISPADSWHQPVQDADGRLCWKVRSYHPPRSHLNIQQVAESSEQYPEHAETSTSTESETSVEPADSPESDSSYNILDILNRDCLTHILNYVPITDIIRSECVSKQWQSMVQEYLQGIRTFKTSCWEMAPEQLTTALLRRALQRVGGALQRLHIDHHWSTLNDRTAHVVGKFCPNLEEVKVVGMHTKNWNPLIYGCKLLKSLTFVACNKLTDSSLVQIVKRDSCIESLTVANNTNITGLFLTGSNASRLTSLSFFNCCSLQGTVLCTALDSIPNLTALQLDMCPITLWKMIPSILRKVTKLVELSLSEYASVDCLYANNNDFSESLAHLSELKVLNLSRNIYVSNAVLKQVAQSCTKLESLNISSCNRNKPYPGVSDDSINAVCAACRQLTRLEMSYLAELSDAGVAAAARLPRLRTLVARGNPALTARSIAACLAACPHLQEVDLCGCDSVSEEVVFAAVRALDSAPRALRLHLAGTSAVALAEELPTHKLLTVNNFEDLSKPYLRPDFVDRMFDEDSEDDSFDDMYDHEPFNQFFEDEDVLFMDEEFEDYDGFAYRFEGHDILLL